MFSIMTMASSTTKPWRDRQRHQREIVDRKPASHIPAQVPANANGTETPAAMVGVIRRRNTNTTTITSIGPSPAASTACPARGANGSGAIDQGRDFDIRPGSIVSARVSAGLDPVDGLDDIGVALLGDLDQDRGLLVEPGDRGAFRTESSTSATSDSRTKLPFELLTITSIA